MRITDRREFLRWSGSAAVAAALPARSESASKNSSGEWRNRQPGMAYRRLGRTNYMVSEIICGGNTISPRNYRHVEEAIERGLNYLDTAPAYGNGQSELGYAKVIKGRRDKVFLNTKVSLWARNRNALFQRIFESLPASEQKKIQTRVRDELERRRALDPDYLGTYNGGQRRSLEESTFSNVMEPKYGSHVDRRKEYFQIVMQSVEESLRRLETAHLDLLMCPHGANSYEEVTAFPEIFEAFEKLKKAGKVRHLAVSSHSDPAGVLRGCVDSGVYSAAMVAYNIINQRYLDAALDKAQAADLGVIAMKVARPVHHGRNNGLPNDPRRLAILERAMPGGDLKAPQKCYLWVLRDPRVAAVNSEMINSQMVAENLPLAGQQRQYV